MYFKLLESEPFLPRFCLPCASIEKKNYREQLQKSHPKSNLFPTTSLLLTSAHHPALPSQLLFFLPPYRAQLIPSLFLSLLTERKLEEERGEWVMI